MIDLVDIVNIINTIIPFMTLILGLYVGQKITSYNEKRKEKKELTKIKYLLDADYTLINRNVKDLKENQNDGYKALINDFKIVGLLNNLKMFQDYGHYFNFNVQGFTYWNSLMSSGKLIKLEPDELRIITLSHDSIMRIIAQQKELFNRFLYESINELFTTPLDMKSKINIFKPKYDTYHRLMINAYDIIKKNVDGVKKNISWIELQSEPIITFKN